MIKCAVIGVGNMGRHHARNYFQISGAELVAISDKNASLGQEIAAKYHCRFYRNYREMLKREKTIEAVSVVTPTSYTTPACRQVIHPPATAWLWTDGFRYLEIKRPATLGQDSFNPCLGFLQFRLF